MRALSETVRATPGTARAITAPIAKADPPARLRPTTHPASARGVALRLRDAWLPRVAWSVGRTGRPGLAGIALLVAAGLFLLSTHRQVAAEVAGLRADVATAQSRARTAAPEVPAEPTPALRSLPTRTEVPALLRELFDEARKAGLAVDTAKYEIASTKGGGVVRYQVAFPVTGPYPQIRAFIDSILSKMPAVGLQELALERKTIGDSDVEAQIRLTVYTRGIR